MKFAFTIYLLITIRSLILTHDIKYVILNYRVPLMKQEVVDIMMTLFNREQILEAYVEEEKRIAAREAAKEATQNTGKAAAINLHNMGMDVAFIAKAINQSDEVVKSWLGL